MKILLLDLETAPLTVYAWGLWKQNINIKNIIDSGSMLCWAAKWLDKDEVMFSSIMGGQKKMLKTIHKLLDEADAVIHYNGSRFDIPTLNKEFLEAGMPPPSPYAQIDLLKTARQQFRFPSNKLDYVGRALGLGQKVSHEGFELWIKCMNKDKEAWGRMQAYNVQDVLLLEKVYYRFLPWIKNHPNKGIHQDKDHVCPNCGSSHVIKRGFNHSKSGKYQRFQCAGCSTWSASRRNSGEARDTLKSLL